MDIPGLLFVCVSLSLVCIYIVVVTEDRGHEIVSIGMASYKVKGVWNQSIRIRISTSVGFYKRIREQV